MGTDRETVIVTGSSGLIGSAVVNRLAARFYRRLADQHTSGPEPEDRVIGPRLLGPEIDHRRLQPLLRGKCGLGEHELHVASFRPIIDKLRQLRDLPTAGPRPAPRCPNENCCLLRRHP